MFQQRRQAVQGNIKLGNLNSLPTYEDLGFLLEQATKFRGRFAEVSWSVPKTGAVFQLTAKVQGGQLPAWMLYGGAPGNSQLLWGHNSNDLTLIHNLVMLECEKPLDGGNTISAGAMDSMIQANTNVGAVGAAAAASMTQPAPAVNASAPGAQWLQNLNYGGQQGGGAAAAQAPDTVPEAPAASTATLDPSIQNLGDLLDGSLTNISVANLFHYLSNNRLSGRLAISSGPGAGEVFFQTGQFKHAATLETKGENALYDMATWEDGEFQFHAEEQTVQQSVQSDARDIVAGCKAIIQYFRMLVKQASLHPASYLVRTANLSRPEFDRAVTGGGMQMDAMTQWRFYQEATGDRTFAEILRCCPLVRAEWIPVVYNLVNTGVLRIDEKPATTRPGMYLEGEPINSQSITAFANHITQPDGLLANGAFLYLLEMEYFRHERTGSRFSLALFTMAQTNMLDGTLTALDPQAWMEAMRRIVQAKRKLDVLGQFDAQNCAILLPETDAAGAAVFANRIIHLMKKPALTGIGEGQALVHSFGIAAVPDDARGLDTLIAAARVAKNKSRMMGAPIICFGDSNQ